MNVRTKLSCSVLALAIGLSGCVTPGPLSGGGQQDSNAGLYFKSCFAGAAGAVLLEEIFRRTRKPGTPVDIKRDIVPALAVGCLIGFAVTAVGKIYAESERKKAEEVAQRDAKRRSDELQRYAQAKSAAEAMPATTAQQRDLKDKQMAKVREDFERTFQAPTTETVGAGSSIEIRPTVPTVVPDMSKPGGCYERTVLGRSPSGTARQKETICTDAQGQPVIAQVQELPS